MARILYGGTPGDVVAAVSSDDGDFEPATATFNVYDARTGGTQITDLLDVDSNVVTQVVPDDDGMVEFYGPDGEDGSLYIEATTGGRRYRIDPSVVAGSSTPGASAYEIAVANGYVGTEEEWLLSLQGADGSPGADGAAGADGADGDPGADGVDGTNGVTVLAFVIDDLTSTFVGSTVYTNDTGEAQTLLAVRVRPTEVSTAGTLRLDTNVNGTTAFTTQANRPTLTTGATSALSGTIDAPTLGPGQRLSFDLDETATFPGGTELSVVVTLR